MFKPDNIWVVWDKKLNYPSTNYRKQAAPETYKQNRDTEKTIKVHEQHDILTNWLSCLGIKQMYPWVLEADDIISWLVREKMNTSTIVTVDKDMLQLVSGSVQYFNPIKKNLITYKNFEDQVGVKPENFVYYKALLGDKSDNIDGLEGFGTVKSKKVSQNSYNEIIKLLTEEERQTFDKNILLVDLFNSYNKENGEVECYEKQYTEQNNNLVPDINKFIELSKEYEFKSIINDIESWKETFTRSQSLTNLISLLG
jgi:5'-3' exonuclease